MARPPLSAEECEARRDSALKAAFNQAENGEAAEISIRGIAREMRLSPMALYRYFPDGRDEILATLRGRGFDALARSLRKAIQHADEPIARIVGLVTGGVHFACTERTTYRLMYAVTQAEDRLGDLAAKRRNAWTVVLDVFTEAMQFGVIQGDPDMLPHVFFASAHGAISLEQSRQPYDERRLEQLLVPMLGVLLRGAFVAEPTIEKVPMFVERTLINLKKPK